MRIAILLHSTTGNTRLVTRFAARHLSERGHDCVVHDIVKEKEPLRLDNVDLLGLSCPTMYFRPTVIMERYIARMPNSRSGRKPAFLLATAHGEPGAHFWVLAELLAHKGYDTLGSRFVPMPTNWPTHRAVVSQLSPATPLATFVNERHPEAGHGLSWACADLVTTTSKDRDGLMSFLDTMTDRVLSGWTSSVPRPEKLYRGSLVATIAGRLLTIEMMRKGTSVFIDGGRCTKCGTCVKVCPSGCISREDDDDVPRVGPNCTGCWTCFNRCKDGAISGFKAEAGRGRYHGPNEKLRELFGQP